MVGKHREVELLLIALLCRGHVLIEDVPGVGKTVLAKAVSRSIGASFKRIQFTPDLLPSDVTGVSVFNPRQNAFEFRPGPIFAQMVLADEINRATPKTQSALLEAMQEHSITVGGTIHKLQEPFFVLATQNPIEQEGTYPLPEAQLDRFFFKLIVNYSGREEMATILDRTTKNEWPQPERIMNGAEILQWQALIREVLIAGPVQDYAIRLVLATHPQGEFAAGDTNRFIRCGASPRAAQAIVLASKVRALLQGRYNVSFDDVRAAYLPALRHRVLLNFEAQAENIPSDQVLGGILNEVKEKAPTDGPMVR